MLVLTFRKEEEAVIQVGGETVKVKFLRSEGAKVKLGFDGPRSVLVHRAAVWA